MNAAGSCVREASATKIEDTGKLRKAASNARGLPDVQAKVASKDEVLLRAGHVSRDERKPSDGAVSAAHLAVEGDEVNAFAS